jgi:hypothetical protein
MVRTNIPQVTINEIIKSRNGGLSYSKLSLKFQISKDRIIYLLNDKYREKVKRRRNENYKKNKKKLTKEQKDKIKKYQKEYHKRKYNNDPEFRKKHIKMVSVKKRSKKI